MDFIRDSFSGAVGAVCCVYAGLPLDTLKIRMQLGSSEQSLMSTYRTVMQEEGWRALFKGATPALASAMVENSVVFAVNGLLTRLVQDFQFGNTKVTSLDEVKDQNRLAWTTQLLIGGASGFCSATAICAPEVVKCRLQMDRRAVNAAAARTAVLSIYRADGIAGFAKGIQALWMRDVPFYFAFFGAYSALTRGYHTFIAPLSRTQPAKEQQVPLFFCWLNGGLAGSLAWATVFPSDIVKSLQQTSPNRLSFTAAATQIYEGRSRSSGAAVGIRAFYQGCLPAVLRGFPANAALFLGMLCLSCCNFY